MIVHTSFGFATSALRAAWYGPDIFESEKARKFEEHMRKVALVRPIPTTVTATLVDRSGGDVDGTTYDWVTELPTKESE